MPTDAEIKNIIKEKNINSIYLQFSDISGQVKNINLPAYEIDRILNNEISFDGSAVCGFRNNETEDLFCYPDKNTFLAFPFKFSKLQNTARLICDIYKADGMPYPGCPRANLKRVIENAKKYDYTMKIAPETEFFLFKVDENSNIISTLKDSVGYYDLNSDENLEDVLASIVASMAEMGWDINAVHHEGAPFQHEIDLGYDDVLRSADNFATFKFVVKAIALKYGLNASFMPKPVYGINGSGLHLNLVLSQNGKNAFYDPAGTYQLSETAQYVVGSLLKNVSGITALLNPSVNSYKRLVKDYEAPIYIAWSVLNRGSLVRIPSNRDEDTRIELRSPDASINPYFAFAAVLQTCMDGIRNKIDPPAPIEKDLFQLSNNEIKLRKIKSLPENLSDALDSFEKNLTAKASLGEYIFDEFLTQKRAEWNMYRKQVTKWELETYLDV